MKLVQMPRDLLSVESDDLPALGVHPDIVAAILARCAGDPLTMPSLALLGPAQSGTTAALMVLARTVGVALRDENIRLRDTGGDLQARRRKLCYLPGAVLSAALRSAGARRALRAEAAVFLQSLDAAWAAEASAPAIEVELGALLAERHHRGVQTFVSADPAGVPADVRTLLLERFDAVTVHDAMSPEASSTSV